jgi:hypothetical protein
MSAEIPITPPDELEDVPSDYIVQNQAFWDNARRGIFSRPMEIPALLSTALHNRIVETFELNQAQQPTVVWSVVFDNPKSPSSKYVYERRFPEDVPKKEETNYAVGIDRINEYVTSYATREFIRRNTDAPVLRAVSKGYRFVSELATYGLLLSGTYRRMIDIEILAKAAGKDFKGALWEGLFNHNFDPINGIIADTTDFTGLSNLNELAIQIGRTRLKRLDIGKLVGKLETNRTDGALTKGAKNACLSIAAGGVFRTPGIIELSGIMITLAPLIPFIGVHESIPANLIHKEVTPHMAKFEGE